MDHKTTSQYEFVVRTNERAAEGVWRMTLASPVAQLIRPGQFVNIAVPGDGSHILRIPLSFKHADPEAGTLELLYAIVGEGTKRLSAMRAGESSTLLGPCGNGWRLPRNPRRCLLVAGGIGLPPVLAAARMLADAQIPFDMVVGARTYAMHVLPDAMDAIAYGENDGPRGYDPDRMVILTTDDGSTAQGVGKKMFATDGMEDLLGTRAYSQVYTCGPTVMMACVAGIAAKHGLACQASLERMMGCGFGACSCCNVELVQGGYALCCQDGPVFDATEVVW